MLVSSEVNVLHMPGRVPPEEHVAPNLGLACSVGIEALLGHLPGRRWSLTGWVGLWVLS